MTLEDLQKWACNELAQSDWLTERNVTAVAESKADADAEVDQAYSMFGISALAMTPGFRADGGQEAGQVPGVATLAIQIAEIPALNRAAPGHATALAAAQHIGVLASTWPGAKFTGLRLVALDDDLKDQAVAYQAEIEIAIVLTLDTTPTPQEGT